MKTWMLALAWMSLALAGCKTDPAVTLMERDNRLKEDEIWRLRGQIEDLQDALEAQGARPTGVVPAPGLVSPAPGTPVGPDLRGPLPPAAGVAPSTAPPSPSTKPAAPARPKRPSPEDYLPPDVLKPPVINVDPGPIGPVDGRQSQPAPRSSSSSRGKAGALAARRGHGRNAVSAASAKVTQVTLNKSLTGGYQQEGKPGDQGVRLVIEPRDSQGRVLAAPADISVAAFDPALGKDAPPVARWHVTAAQAARMTSGQVPGIPLSLAWPAVPPAHDSLQLFVQYKTADGRQFQIDGPVQVAISGSRPSGSLPLAEGPLLEPARMAGDSWQPAPVVGRVFNPSTPDAHQASIPSRSAPGWAPNPSPRGEEQISDLSATPETPRAPEAETPRVATRPESPKSQRPVWSPERR
jgi:hypothetical protein